MPTKHWIITAIVAAASLGIGSAIGYAAPIEEVSRLEQPNKQPPPAPAVPEPCLVALESSEVLVDLLLEMVAIWGEHLEADREVFGDLAYGNTSGLDAYALGVGDHADEIEEIGHKLLDLDYLDPKAECLALADQ